jgi:hypothetical protein
MAETHFLVGGGGIGRLDPAVDDHFFRRYRQLADAEDAAFDELEHAYEEGDRATFENDLAAWHTAIMRRSTFLETHGFSANSLPV